MSNQPNNKDIRRNYKWFIESCNKFKKDIIPYKQFKREFINNCKLNQTPEEQERLTNMQKALNKVMEMLK